MTLKPVSGPRPCPAFTRAPWPAHVGGPAPTPRGWENRSLLPLAPGSPRPSWGLRPPVTKQSSQATSKGLCYVTGTFDLKSALSFLYHISRWSLAASVTCREEVLCTLGTYARALSDKGGDGQVSIRDHAAEFQKDQWPRPGDRNSTAKGQMVSISGLAGLKLSVTTFKSTTEAQTMCNKWVWLGPNKTLFTKNSGGPDLAHRL